MPPRNERIDPRKRRTLNYNKCFHCRRDKKGCEPANRQWPSQKCTRCSKEDLPCSEPQLRKAGGFSKSWTGLLNQLPASHSVEPAGEQLVHDQLFSSNAWYQAQLAEKDTLIASRDATIRALKAQVQCFRTQEASRTKHLVSALRDISLATDRDSEWWDDLMPLISDLDTAGQGWVFDELSAISALTDDDYLGQMIVAAVNVDRLSCDAELGHEDYLAKLQAHVPGSGEPLSLERWAELLIIACKNRCSKAVERISGIEGLSINMLDNHGKTALWYAASQWEPDTVEALLRCPAIDTNLACPLAAAVGYGDETIVKALVECPQTKLNVPDESGKTPLTKAIRNVHWTMVDLFMHYRDRVIVTAEAWKEAASTGRPRVINALLASSEIIHHIDLHDTASAIASKRRDPVCTALLQGLETAARMDGDLGNTSQLPLSTIVVSEAFLSPDAKKKWQGAAWKYRSDPTILDRMPRYY